ncbi:hypothetical protein ACFL54_09920, partial [Planctomycetota bacterium]
DTGADSDDDTITVNYPADAALDGTDLKDMIYSSAGGNVADLSPAANSMANFGTDDITEVDQATPVIIQAGIIDPYTTGFSNGSLLVYSEAIDDSETNALGFELATIPPATAVDYDTGDTADDILMTIIFPQLPVFEGTGTLHDLKYFAVTGQIKDLAGNIAATQDPVEVDQSGPAIVNFQYFDDDTNGFLDRVVITFSEPLRAGQEDISDWILLDADGVTNLLAGLNDNAVTIDGSTITITLNDNSGTNGQPIYVLKTDAAGGYIQDLVWNEAPEQTNNNTPVVFAGDDVDVRPSLYTINGSAVDADNQSLDIQWTQTGGLGLENVNIQNATQPVSKVKLTRDGVYEFQLVAVDPLDASDNDTILITVDNVFPTANAGADMLVNKDNIANVTLTGDHSNDTDVFSDIISYAWTKESGPSNVNINNANAANANFDTAGLTEGIYVFQLAVEDEIPQGNPPAARTLDTVTVIITSDVVLVPNSDAGLGVTVLTNTLVTLDGHESATTTLGGTIDVYTWTQTEGPENVVINPTAVPSQSTFTPTLVGIYKFTLTVTDNLGIESEPDEVQFIVLAQANQPPYAIAGDNQHVFVDNEVTLDGSDSGDNDGDDITYKWTQTSGPDADLSDDTAAQPTFTPAVVSKMVFKLVVTDGGGLESAPAIVTVIVDEQDNLAPIADAGDFFRGNTDVEIQLDGSGSSDPEGAGLTYHWRQPVGPIVNLEDADTASPTFTASVSRTCIFELIVNDGIL